MGTVRWMPAVMLACLAAVGACDSGKSAKSQCADGGACGMTSQGLLNGRVLDANAGRAVDKATLKSQSGQSAQSDRKGNFELPAREDLEQVEVSKQNYVASVKRAPEQGGYMEVFIKSVDKSEEFDAEQGIELKLASGVTVDIPGGAVRDAKGQPVKGKVKLSVADVDGSVRTQASALPGDLKGENEQGDKGLVSVVRAVEITVTDSQGTKLQVGAEDKVVAEFPAKDKDAAERTGLSFDEEKDAWREEGKVKRADNEAGDPVYVKDVDHLSWHGYGDFFAKLTCLKACVQDDAKAALPGAQVWLVGSTFAGVSSLFTGQDGCVVADAPIEQELVLVGQVKEGVSPPVRYTTSKVEQSAAAGACEAAEPLVIKRAAASGCAAGFVECDDMCLDPAAGATECGAVQPAEDAGVATDAGTAEPVQSVMDPAPGLDAPGETRCDACPDTDLYDFEIEPGAVTQTRFSGTVTGAEGNGRFYVIGADGGAIQGPIPTDAANGGYNVSLPLFCGAQTIKLLWTNAAGETVAVIKALTTDCVEPEIRVTLTWDDKGRDFELHLIKEGGRINDAATDCTWTSCIGSGPDWGVAGDTSDNPLKDVDNTGNYGPENILLAKPENLTYTVMVEHWGGSGLPQAAGQVIVNLKGKGTTIIDIANLAPSHVFNAATIAWPSAVVTKVATDFDCSMMWSGGCTDAIP